MAAATGRDAAKYQQMADSAKAYICLLYTSFIVFYILSGYV